MNEQSPDPQHIQSQLSDIQSQLGTVVRFEVEVRSIAKSALIAFGVVAGVGSLALGAVGLWINSEFSSLSDESKRLGNEFSNTEERLRVVEIALGTTAAADKVAGVLVLADGVDLEEQRGCFSVMFYDLPRGERLVFSPLHLLIPPVTLDGLPADTPSDDEIAAAIERAHREFKAISEKHAFAHLASVGGNFAKDLGVPESHAASTIILSEIPVEFLEELRDTFGADYTTYVTAGAYRWSLADIGRQVDLDMHGAVVCGGGIWNYFNDRTFEDDFQDAPVPAGRRVSGRR